ncbi:predicted protein [Plenodomus lingam JN3]|uniref:Predicted protein n=1 Tax=Leptosphaeria maculans (strain JN3 / isolate v23.1.3 / race Av1-4-5-6-7-8) TaxID=985895 RepID=E5A0Q7_LEPMJ|nr:predicted protein [Plenodomus lingam JN3]CBX97203.1 predicted protein [Plenodomus lingam JN3]
MRLGTKVDGVRVLVLGEAGVGKTCFADMFLKGENFIYHDPFDEIRRVLVVNHKEWPLQPVDISSTMLRESGPTLDKAVFDSSIASCQGIVLIYDVTSHESFDLVTQDAYMHVLRLRQAMSGEGNGGGMGTESGLQAH